MIVIFSACSLMDSQQIADPEKVMTTKAFLFWPFSSASGCHHDPNPEALQLNFFPFLLHDKLQEKTIRLPSELCWSHTKTVGFSAGSPHKSAECCTCRQDLSKMFSFFLKCWLCCVPGFCSSGIIVERKKVCKYLCLVYWEIAICVSCQVKSQW